MNPTKLLVGLCCTFVYGQGLGAQEREPQLRGPYNVGMTYFQASDSFRPYPVHEIWQYTAGSTDGKYVDKILKHPDAVEQLAVEFPQHPEIFPIVGGQKLDVFYYVAYPTTTDNARKNYRFPGGNEHSDFERMQRPGDEPLLDGTQSHYPMVVFSHGWATLATGDVWRAKMFASHGYIVVNAFYGDQRVRGSGGNLEHPSMRLFMIKSLISHLLASKHFGPRINPEQIGISGGSFGGASVLACLGGRIANRDDVAPEPRIKAGVATVPWVGAFGNDHAGLSDVDRPFMQIYGSSDGLSSSSIRCMDRLSQSDCYLIKMVGQGHAFQTEYYVDAFNWELHFFNAYLRNDPEAFRVLQETSSFAGFGNDIQQVSARRIRESKEVLTD